MKRVADKQLIKDGRDEEEVRCLSTLVRSARAYCGITLKDDEVGTGFKKADESTLARRQIRGLPKRSLATSAAGPGPAPVSSGFSWGAPAPAPATTSSEVRALIYYAETLNLKAGRFEKDAPPVSKFAGFSGFGNSSTTTPSSFSFGPSSMNATASSPSSTTLSSSTFGSTAPTTTAGASNAAKAFASFLGGGVATNGSDSKPAVVAATTHSSTTSISGEDKRAVTYYTSLRGLNVSLLDSINKYVDQDPFVDLSVLLEQYKSKRADIQKEFDAEKKGSNQANGTSTATSAAAKFTPPLPSGSAFAPPTISASSSTDSKTSLGSGFTFTPKPAPLTSKSSFTLPPSTESKPADSKPSSSGFSFGGSSSSNASSATGGFTFGAPAKDPAPAAPSSGSFGFGVSAKSSHPSSTTSSSSFSFAAPAKDNGPSSTPSSSGFSFGAPVQDTSSSSGFTFGAPSMANTAPSSSLPFALTPASSSSAPKPFPFGSDKLKVEEKKEDVKPAGSSSSSLFGLSSNSSSTSSPFGTFGKPAGTSGFSFGGSTTSFGGDSKPFSFGGSSTPSVPTNSGFSFGGSSGAAPKKDDEMEDNKEEASASAGNEAAAEGAPSAAAMLGVNPHDEEGEGEEEEETVHAIKSKAFRMKKADEKGGPGWVEIGYGVLRLKKHKETSARRMLLRNSTTGKININFALYPGLKPSLAKKAVTFIGHDNGVAQTYSVRVPNEEAAKDLKEALEREIAFVKAKESE
ncbi:hypothetical protein NMY22_g667 [Coprinellus aureogranulatus]|nr:hypothetical protein NMY22_g667 [Coprinellus aureogranulatus]